MTNDAMNDAIRRAAGRRAGPQLDTTATPPVGDLGGGRGGSARPMVVRDDPGAKVNQAVRTAWALKRGRLAIDELLA